MTKEFMKSNVGFESGESANMTNMGGFGTLPRKETIVSVDKGAANDYEAPNLDINPANVARAASIILLAGGNVYGPMAQANIHRDGSNPDNRISLGAATAPTSEVFRTLSQEQDPGQGVEIPASGTAATKASHVRIRMEPSRSGEIVTTIIDAGTTGINIVGYEVIGPDTWYHVQYDGQNGWILSTGLKPPDGQPVLPTGPALAETSIPPQDTVTSSAVDTNGSSVENGEATPLPLAVPTADIYYNYNEKKSFVDKDKYIPLSPNLFDIPGWEELSGYTKFIETDAVQELQQLSDTAAQEQNLPKEPVILKSGLLLPYSDGKLYTIKDGYYVITVGYTDGPTSKSDTQVILTSKKEFTLGSAKPGAQLQVNGDIIPSDEFEKLMGKLDKLNKLIQVTGVDAKYVTRYRYNGGWPVENISGDTLFTPIIGSEGFLGGRSFWESTLDANS